MAGSFCLRFCSLSGARANRGDLHRGERLAVPALAAVALAALVLEDDDLLAQALLDDLRLDGHAADGWAAHRDAASVIGHQQWSERNLGPRRTGELLDAQGFPFADAVLFSTRLDDGVHVS